MVLRRPRLRGVYDLGSVRNGIVVGDLVGQDASASDVADALHADGTGRAALVTMLTSGLSTVADGELSPGRRFSLPAQIGGRLGRLVVAIQAFEEIPTLPKTRRTQKLTPQQLNRACDAMMERHAEPVRLSAIAGVVGLSPWQFSRSFHASAGLKFTVYLLRIRLDAAMRLMVETNKSLCEIALASGFGDQSNFSRLFVRSQGITPLKWRRLRRG
jgi:AraC-like DNA-binding protein